MISSQLHHFQPSLDEIIKTEENDFVMTGLKLPSVIRLSRLAVVEQKILLGRLGEIGNERLLRLKMNLCQKNSRHPPDSWY